MIPTPVITAMSNAIVLALTPTQRWDAAGRFNSNSINEDWFIITAIVLLAISSILLYAVSYYRNIQEQKVTNRLFAEYADKRGLTEHERKILLNIANNAELKQKEAIFTMSSAFDHGAAKITKKGKHLNTELSSLREKLGFKSQNNQLKGTMLKQKKKLSSRHIPVGHKLYITRSKVPAPSSIESTVIENNDMGFRIKPTTPVEVTPGDSWCVRYYFGSSVWEFDTSVVSCIGEILVLSHSDNVRFINRRRFLRVTVNKPAFIAHFPFTKTFTTNINNNVDSNTQEYFADASSGTWGPPSFIPVVITELAGPGLRIQTPQKIKVDERVLVVFELDKEKDEVTGLQEKDETSKIVEDIGEVRHVQATQNGWSIAVELIGLSDSNINELIRATNAASLKANAQQDQNIPLMADEEEHARESAAVEGA